MHKFNLEKLLKAVDLPRLAEKYKTKLTPHRGGKELRGKCPLHANSNNPTAFVLWQDNDDIWHWHCYTDCDTGGNAIGFIMRAENITDFVEAVKWLADYLSGKTTEPWIPGVFPAKAKIHGLQLKW